MIADHGLSHTIQAFGLGAAALVGAVGLIMTSWRRNRLSATKALLDIAEQERELLRERASRLEGELGEQRDRHTAEITMARQDIAKLTGIVEQQRSEIEQLRQLVMLESVPTPLVQAMQNVAEQTAAKIIAELKGERV